MPRVLCAWFPHWPLQRRCVARPELNARAHVLYAVRPRGALEVVAASAAARARNIRVGLPLAEARALAAGRSSKTASRDAELLCEADDPAADRAALVALAVRCADFSPLVGLEEGPRPECLWLDLTGLARLFGGEEALVRQVAGRFADDGLRARLALADTPGAAWAVAHFGPLRSPGAGASRRSAPDEPPPGWTIVPAGQTRAAVARLPPAALRLDADCLGALAALGLTTIDQVWRLPRAALPIRFGPQLLLRIDQLLGTQCEPLAACHGPQIDERTLALEPPVEHSEPLCAALEQLWRAALRALAPRGQGVVRWDVALRDVQGRPVRLAFSLSRPCAALAHLQGLVQLRLERLPRLPPVAHVALCLREVAPLGWRQTELFELDAPAEANELPALLDRLQTALGATAVVQPRRVAEALPELAGADVPWTPAAVQRIAARRTAGPRAAAGSRAAEHDPLGRPLHVLAAPQRVRVVAVAPHGPPAQFVWNGRTHLVVRHAGPERIEGGWWRGRQQRRDYYRVETSSGGWFWLFRAGRAGGWWLHGEYV